MAHFTFWIGHHGAEACRATQSMRQAKGQELEDWQEYCYVDIVKYKKPWRIRAKVAGLQETGSQSVTWIPLSEALDNMLLYIEDHKWEKERKDFERFKTAVVHAPANSAFVAHELLEDPGHTVCVGVSHSRSARRLTHCIASFFLVEASFKHWRDLFSLAYYYGMDAVNGMRNLEGKSRKEDVTRNTFKKLVGPSLWQKVCAHMNLKDATIHSTQSQIDALITEQWVTFHLDHVDNKHFLNQTAGMWLFCSFSARGLAHSPTISSHIHGCRCEDLGRSRSNEHNATEDWPGKLGSLGRRKKLELPVAVATVENVDRCTSVADWGQGSTSVSADPVRAKTTAKEG